MTHLITDRTIELVESMANNPASSRALREFHNAQLEDLRQIGRCRVRVFGFSEIPAVGSAFKSYADKKEAEGAAAKAREEAAKNAFVMPFISMILGYDVFDRLSNRDIFLMGVTQKPIPADGFVRPAADFWIHDARHNSALYARRASYIKEHGLNPILFYEFKCIVVDSPRRYTRF